jgi:chromosome segregation protein
MLIALELAGFKSFADKTRFDFPEGITVIVGPNGSGKSNVVDAIKWVLGAQSAKSLRGNDMIDVIFKGSSASGRKPGNSAEATLVFDNKEKRLNVDANEVQVTRRVFRSGEGEYLINGQACRLKDIKDLFRGTGVGVDAYSLIEQGKVDRMLQASPKDRRVIFEEAAGISRFKSKKTEALRRLQRVEQNLIRLRDIVDEVRGRLNGLKSQANKAQRYREMTQRLHELRLRLGWTEYCELQSKLKSTEDQLAECRADHESRQSELTDARDQAHQAELALHRVAEKCQQVETALQEALQSIAVGKNQQASLSQRMEENLAETQKHRVRMTQLRARASELQSEMDAVAEKLANAEMDATLTRERAQTAAALCAGLREQLQLRAIRHDELRHTHVEYLNRASSNAAQVAQLENTLADLQNQIQSTQTAIEGNQQTEQTARRIAEEAAKRLQQIHEESKHANDQLIHSRTTLDQYRAEHSLRQSEAAAALGKLQGTADRLQILEQLQQHLEGVDAGARQLVELVRQQAHPAFQSVVGLVAELIEADANIAPMIDTALGHASHALVLADGQLIQMIRNSEVSIQGRLSLMRLDRLPTRRFGEKIQLDGVRGVLGRADRLIHCDETVQPLFRHLLGTTWLVDTLDTAIDLGHFRGNGLRFVTSQCQLIEADGTLTLGVMQSSVGLVSRRSEIQTARLEIEQLKQGYQSSQVEAERLQGRIAKLVPTIGELESKAKTLSQELARQQSSAQAAVGKLDALEQESIRLKSSLDQLVRKRETIEPNVLVLREQHLELQQQIDAAEAELQTHESTRRQQDAELTIASEELTAGRIEQARAEQRLEALKVAYEQCSRSQRERLETIEQLQSEIERKETKVSQIELEILELTSQLAQDYLRSEMEEESLDELAAEASILRNNRTSANKRLDQVTRAIEKMGQRVQTVEAESVRTHDAMQSLVSRLADDYQIDLEQLRQSELIEEGDQRSAFQSEASKLRQDIASVGEVNLTALNELDELQSRYDYLNGQYEDLQAAKESLQRIIQKINADSKKLFLETLEIIRQNFQKLYRKSFGGGNADIVLEDTEDVLECGIDIIATPPGKTALSNSLLSGGEKALTAVALLLAIFQYRPSPFCVLDEVDAPFDEANIGRFVSVLTEFLDWTKFIVVTHSKKTMTAANTLYGVTMQESGISKQVAVRFENVNDKGEIIEDLPAEKTSRRRAA